MDHSGPKGHAQIRLVIAVARGKCKSDEVEDCNRGRKKSSRLELVLKSFILQMNTRYLLTCFKLAFFAPNAKHGTNYDLQHYLTKIVGSKF